MSGNISAIILAGGEGRRMNGANKALQRFQDKPLISHVIERLTPQVDDIVISANRDVDKLKALGFLIVSDGITNERVVGKSLGPLSGIYAAATHCQHERIFICPCDMPFLSPTIVSFLAATSAPAVVAQSNHGIEPLVCLVEKQQIKTIPDYLNTDRLSVKHWLKDQQAITVDATELGDACFLNINTIEELNRLSTP